MRVQNSFSEVITIILCVVFFQLNGQSNKSQIAILTPSEEKIDLHTKNSGSDEEPEWSPDGTHILFDSKLKGNRDLYVMDGNGLNIRRLTSNPAKEDHGSWSPDGSKIAYQHQGKGNTDVYVMNADGTNQKRLTTHAARDGWPDWSPNGREIVFSSERDGHREIYIMNSDGTNQRRLTNNDYGSTDPSFSPNGKWIAFNAEIKGNSCIFIMKANGSKIRKLTTSEFYDERPCWSPDGKRILFTRGNQRTMKYALLSIDKRGDDLKMISPKNHSIIRGNWSPDGQKIVAQKITIKKKTPEKTVYSEFKPEAFDKYSGTYVVRGRPNMKFSFRREKNRFFGDGACKKSIELLPSSNVSFFPKQFPGEIIFHQNEKGVFDSVTINIGKKIKAFRSK
ncbi:DUF5050 domain-containing protein [Seonamhaeicola marinus]|uniref:DUF5050 domain-containing protein n=1 Tax=Seonamhaeicola marinus TaxID=1912246 RepID=A0A5D0HK56_9FLAO|nr:DUF5050 domain-containing protein [Seonamhaeicola marinus]TYA71701.1 DUF5050 domain-containing protein [Seonamhaeicola marinus]